MKHYASFPGSLWNIRHQRSENQVEDVLPGAVQVWLFLSWNRRVD